MEIIKRDLYIPHPFLFKDMDLYFQLILLPEGDNDYEILFDFVYLPKTEDVYIDEIDILEPLYEKGLELKREKKIFGYVIKNDEIKKIDITEITLVQLYKFTLKILKEFYINYLLPTPPEEEISNDISFFENMGKYEFIYKTNTKDNGYLSTIIKEGFVEGRDRLQDRIDNIFVHLIDSIFNVISELKKFHFYYEQVLRRNIESISENVILRINEDRITYSILETRQKIEDMREFLKDLYPEDEEVKIDVELFREIVERNIEDRIMKKQTSNFIYDYVDEIIFDFSIVVYDVDFVIKENKRPFLFGDLKSTGTRRILSEIFPTLLMDGEFIREMLKENKEKKG